MYVLKLIKDKGRVANRKENKIQCFDLPLLFSLCAFTLKGNVPGFICK